MVVCWTQKPNSIRYLNIPRDENQYLKINIVRLKYSVRVLDYTVITGNEKFS